MYPSVRRSCSSRALGLADSLAAGGELLSERRNSSRAVLRDRDDGVSNARALAMRGVSLLTRRSFSLIFARLSEGFWGLTMRSTRLGAFEWIRRHPGEKLLRPVDPGVGGNRLGNLGKLSGVPSESLNGEEVWRLRSGEAKEVSSRARSVELLPIHQDLHRGGGLTGPRCSTSISSSYPALVMQRR